ncbi:MAG: ABC transporter permease [Myxococcales bacterium]|nr:ABC transporter permease [Myxococcales bacterium]
MSDRRPSPLWQLFLVRVRVYLRAPVDVFWTFGIPMVTAIVLGVAFRARGPAPIRVAIERAEPAATAEVAAVLGATPGVRAIVAGPAEAEAALRAGRVAVTVRPGAPVRYRFDPTRQDGRLARLAVAAALDRAADRAAADAAVDELVTEPGGRYIDFLIPGLIGMTLLSISLWGVGTPIVDARARRQLKRLAATPMPRASYLLALVLGHLILAGAVIAVMLGFARLAFDVEVRGSLGAVAVVGAVGALACAGLAILAASRTASGETIQGLNNLILLPQMIASGVFFASAQFPDAAQPLIRALPLTALADALRAVTTEGASLVAVGPDLAILAAWGVGSFALGLRVFRWT